MSVRSQNILLVATASPQGKGGLSTYQRELARALSVGHQVAVAARSVELPRVFSFDGCDRDMPGRSQPAVLLMNYRPGWRPVLRCMHSFLARRPLRGAGIALFERAYAPSLERALPWRPDIVHYSGTGFELTGHVALRIARRHRAVFSVLPAVHPRMWGDGTVDLDFYARADRVFTLSEHERRHLMALGLEERKVLAVMLGAPQVPVGNAMRFRARYGLTGRPVVLHIGAKSTGKGFQPLCAALRGLIADRPEIVLVAIGRTTAEPAPSLPPDNYIDLAEADDQAKADALAACHVYAMPSSGESFGLAYLEAWAAGKPVIGGPSPAVLELIRDRVDGLHVDQAPATIAGALGELIAAPALAAKLGEAGRRRVTEECSWVAAAERHLAAWQEMAR